MEESKQLLEALSREPEFKLSVDFADKVMMRIRAIEAKQVLPSFWQYVLLGGAFILIAILLMLFFIGAELADILVKNFYWVLIVAVLILTIQYLDKRLLNDQKIKPTYTFSDSPQ